MTREAADTLHQQDVFEAFVRHIVGDWGDVCPQDWNANQQDADSDGLGDVCDPCTDPDSDGVCGDLDNCPIEPNAG